MTGILGDVQVRSETNFGDTLSYSHTPRYFKWLSNSISEVKIIFKDEYLRDLRMPYGNSFALLHFRQCM